MPISDKLQASPIVSTDEGTVEGTFDNSIYCFKGIPFAAPPTGKNRWRPPQPPLPWEGIREAKHYNTLALQSQYPAGSFFKQPNYPQSEDCLHLNIWTPSLGTSERLPVMVWIHGGYFNYGGGALPNYNGNNLARHGLVVVTFNYRLGVLGFLGHPALSKESAHGVSGNYGLLDQIAALHWVQNNIASFGGDPDNVTVFGESAGSWSISLLVCSPLARGLFHRAIGQSGASTGPTPFLKSAKNGKKAGEEVGAKFVEAAGVDSLEELRSLPFAAVEKAAKASGFYTEPYVDGWLIPDEPRFIMERGTQLPIPVLIGSNRDEATTFTDPNQLPTTVEDFKQDLVRKYGTLSHRLLEAYPVESAADILPAHLDRLGDQLFTLSMRHWAERSCKADIPTYLYHFTRVPNIPQKAYFGAYHGAEIPYVFDNLSKIPIDGIFNKADQELADQIIAYWVNFAYHGNPNGDNVSAWPRYEQASTHYMELGDTVECKQHLLKARLDILEEVSLARKQA